MADMRQIMGANIQKYRKKKGYTQNQLAEMVGLSFNHLSTIETGKSFPKVEKLILIMNVLDCSADEIFSGIVKQSEYVKITQLSEKLKTLSDSDKKKALAMLETFLDFQD